MYVTQQEPSGNNTEKQKVAWGSDCKRDRQKRVWNQTGMNVNKLTLDLKLHLNQQLKKKIKKPTYTTLTKIRSEGRLGLSSIKKRNNDVIWMYMVILSTRLKRMVCM